MNTKNFHYYVLLLLLLLVSGYFFQIGVSHFFILDDTGNLSGLSYLNQESSFSQFLYFIFYDSHTVSGRPVSLLTFALQASSWPNPTPFKQFNISLHLFNGLLVYILCQQLILRSLNKNIPLMSLGVTALWLLSPIQVDTVQYIIQRMAMLASTFTLLGLIVYIYARPLLNKVNQSLFLLYIVFGLCLILAVFSKENGLLLTILVILFEFSLFKNEPRPNYYKTWFGLTIILPLILFIVFIFYNFHSSFLYTYKGFNAIERLWTQQGILVHYLSSILMPSTQKLTLFWDNYPISRSLFSPPSTLLFFLLNSTLIVSAFLTIKRWPLFAIGILFFYSNHLMESTFLRLELYFEHRNYLAILGIFISLFSGLYYIAQNIKKNILRQLLYSIPLMLLLVSIHVNYQQNKLWSNAFYQAHTWYALNPLSPRAHGHYVVQLNNVGLHNEAIQFSQATQNNFPNNPIKPLIWLELTCHLEIKPAPIKIDLLEMMHKARYYKGVDAILNHFIQAFERQKCSGVSTAYFLEIVQALMENPHYRQKKDQLNFLIVQSRMYQLENNHYLAVNALEKAYKIEQRLDIMSSLAEKYIYLNNLKKAYPLIIEMEEYCTKHSIKCANSIKNIPLLKQLYHSVLISGSPPKKKNNE